MNTMKAKNNDGDGNISLLLTHPLSYRSWSCIMKVFLLLAVCCDFCNDFCVTSLSKFEQFGDLSYHFTVSIIARYFTPKPASPRERRLWQVRKKQENNDVVIT